VGVSKEATPDRKEVLRLGELIRKKGVDLEKALTSKSYRDAVSCANTLQRSLDTLRPPLRRLIGTSIRFNLEPSRLRGVARGAVGWFITGAVVGGFIIYILMRAR
jgi:hypothetical protein